MRAIGHILNIPGLVLKPEVEFSWKVEFSEAPPRLIVWFFFHSTECRLIGRKISFFRNGTYRVSQFCKLTGETALTVWKEVTGKID